MVFEGDVQYFHPTTTLQAEMRHVHLIRIDLYYEDRQQYNNTSDCHLAYCSNDDETAYCLLDMLTHEDARSIDVMLALAGIAERSK